MTKQNDLAKIREAYFQAKEDADSDEFAEADALLSEALAWMKNGWEGFNTITRLISSALSSGSMTWEDRTYCWASGNRPKSSCGSGAMSSMRNSAFDAQASGVNGCRGTTRLLKRCRRKPGLGDIFEAKIQLRPRLSRIRHAVPSRSSETGKSAVTSTSSSIMMIPAS